MLAENIKLKNEKKPFRNLTGQKFNMLTVVSFSHFSEKGYPYWDCVCDCGNTKKILENNLIKGMTKSCGCLKSKRCKTLAKECLTVIDGTQIGLITARTTKKNNKSGFRGISWVEKTQKWRVNLTFRGTRYHLGYFSDFDKAVQARIKGEEMVDDFVSAYLSIHEDTNIKRDFENHIRAKEKAEEDFRKTVCKNKDYTAISYQTTITGDLILGENLLISGHIKGDVNCQKSVMINGKVEGNVTAETLYVPSGIVLGNIKAKRIFCSNMAEQITGETIGKISPYKRLENI